MTLVSPLIVSIRSLELLIRLTLIGRKCFGNPLFIEMLTFKWTWYSLHWIEINMRYRHWLKWKINEQNDENVEMLSYISFPEYLLYSKPVALSTTHSYWHTNKFNFARVFECDAIDLLCTPKWSGCHTATIYPIKIKL